MSERMRRLHRATAARKCVKLRCGGVIHPHVHTHTYKQASVVRIDHRQPFALKSLCVCARDRKNIYIKTCVSAHRLRHASDAACECLLLGGAVPKPVHLHKASETRKPNRSLATRTDQSERYSRTRTPLPPNRTANTANFANFSLILQRNASAETWKTVSFHPRVFVRLHAHNTDIRARVSRWYRTVVGWLVVV